MPTRTTDFLNTADDSELIERCQLLLEEELVEIGRRMIGDEISTNERLCIDLWWHDQVQRIAILEPTSHDGLVWKMHAARATAEREGAPPLAITALRDFCQVHPVASVVRPPDQKLPSVLERMRGGDGAAEYYSRTRIHRELARRAERQRDRDGHL